MNEQLQSALSELIQSTQDAKNFIISETPEVISQLLMWKATISVISMVSFFLLTFAIYWVNKKQYQLYKGNEEFRAIFNNGLRAINCFQLFLLAPLHALWSLDWLMIIIAPKIYLIEYAAKLVN